MKKQLQDELAEQEKQHLKDIEKLRKEEQERMKILQDSIAETEKERMAEL